MITAPGAPLTGLALPVSTIPSPSANHHTPTAHAIEPASASRSVGRQAIPIPSSSWTVANIAFSSTA